MPNSTDRRDERRREAVWGAVSATAMRLIAAVVLLWIRAGMTRGLPGDAGGDFAGTGDHRPRLDIAENKTERDSRRRRRCC